jgi:ketosteroid isomerase-like protein
VSDQATTAAATFTEVGEQVRALLAAIAQAQDDGRTEDVVSLYADDGIVEVPGLGAFAGSGALREAFTGWAPAAPQRHLVANTLLTAWDAGSAAARSDVVLVKRGAAGWAVESVARYHDTFRNDGGTWVLAHRRMEFAG